MGKLYDKTWNNEFFVAFVIVGCFAGILSGVWILNHPSESQPQERIAAEECISFQYITTSSDGILKSVGFYHDGERREFAVPENMTIRSGDRFVICEGKN